MVLPGKHTYELIYNRLGNDMLLWLPMIFSVKEHLYNELFPDPLKDPDVGFSRYGGISVMDFKDSIFVPNSVQPE